MCEVSFYLNFGILNRFCFNPLQFYLCKSPENEGLFVTREFQKVYVKKESNCKTYVASYWGECAVAQHLTEKDVLYDRSQGPEVIRSRLFADWKQFWALNVPFLIEKDIPNLVRSRFLQELFGIHRTAFVFILRHPMATCKRFTCDIRRHMESWLTAYSLMETDLTQLRHYIVLHMEGYTQQPQTIISALEEFLQWEKIQYQIRNHTVGAGVESLDIKISKIREKPPRYVMMNKAYEVQRLADPAPSHRPTLRLRNIVGTIAGSSSSGGGGGLGGGGGGGGGGRAKKGLVSLGRRPRGGRGGMGHRQLLGFHGDEKAIQQTKKINQSGEFSQSSDVLQYGEWP